ncbi:thioether cross-link-forming SCIFF peptide maturase [Desulfofundulus thermobenzoicus]|uniref:Thioether cross-link-forming SCIFF peptide maturase n=1 Tax=Desulfofundulus thermobenzoicus TaxID=29376 RepID=A0A6N7IRB2_9FIRM|nr:thioether cross-link-forming SCIFF peptide maturase [Desulfofundulus thermobenzoicus]MQL52655.1 thioether cross-link-forming SCIFF peptide maturase [Desulfofundulus thermobenzoicus]
MIHKFIFNGQRMVLDVNSGALHLVDELTWHLLDDYEKHDGRELVDKYSRRYPRVEVEEALEEIAGLVGEGLLFSPDPLNGHYDPPQNEVVKALCLHLAHDCNLACRYCFAGQGHFGGDGGLMPFTVGRQALDFLFAASGPRRHVEVDFFGGEPLLNFNVLRELVAYGRRRAGELGKIIKFTVTTNAVLLTPAIGRYFNEEGLAVVLSLDGRPPVHDAMRPFPGGRGSYDLVLNNIRNFVASRPGGEYYVRGTFTRHNLDFTRDVLHLAGLGFEHISMEPVVAPCDEDYALQMADVPRICAEYEKLAGQLLDRAARGRRINFFHFNIDPDGGPCLPRRLTGCGAGREYLAVSPDGRLYPCHQFVGRPGYCLGDVWQGLVHPELVAEFRSCHVYSKEDCRQCWARFYCSGGCHANAHAFHGTIFKPYEVACALVKKRIECALYLKAVTA